jgi:hypothetical protein
MNYYLKADEVNMEMAKGIRNYKPICHSKFRKKNLHLKYMIITITKILINNQ